MKLALPVAASLLLCVSAAAALAEPVTGRVAHVVDGDTLDVLLQGKRLRVRLIDIDAPEQKQPYGLRSRQSLIQICAGEAATLQPRGRVRNGRMLAHVVCDTTDANAEKVRRGMAWVFERYAAPDSPLYAIQNEARGARRGLWAEAASMPPWEWRRLADSERAERRMSDTKRGTNPISRHRSALATPALLRTLSICAGKSRTQTVPGYPKAFQQKPPFAAGHVVLS